MFEGSLLIGFRLGAAGLRLAWNTSVTHVPASPGGSRKLNSFRELL